MTEEEYFRKNYPDSCYGDKPLSPHFDFFQCGAEFGERQSEKRIAELEKRCANYEMTISKMEKGTCDICKETEKDKKIEELEQQIVKVKWHKVAYGDVPKNERWVCNQDGCYCYYDVDTEQWLDTEGTRTKTIEWCDMPTKEIKEK